MHRVKQWYLIKKRGEIMIYLKITLENGDYFTTAFNGDFETAERYYKNTVLNVGVVCDELQRVVKIEVQ